MRQERKGFMIKHCFSLRYLASLREITQLNLAPSSPGAQSIKDKSLFFFALLCVSARKTQLSLAQSVPGTQRIHDKTLFFFALFSVTARKNSTKSRARPAKAQSVKGKSIYLSSVTLTFSICPPMGGFSFEIFTFALPIVSYVSKSRLRIRPATCSSK